VDVLRVQAHESGGGRLRLDQINAEIRALREERRPEKASD